MKSVLFAVMLAAVATTAVVSNEVPAVADGHEVADVDVNEMPEVVVPDLDVLDDADERQVQTAAATPRQQSWGTIGSSDRLVYNKTHSGRPVNGVHRDISIRVGSRISAIRATPVGTSPDVRLTIRSGGLGSNHVIFRVHTALGRDYSIVISIYSR